MNFTSQNIKRVLAIDPTTRGFGYAVLEGHDNLIDWGVREIWEDKKIKCLELISDLMDRYQPDVLVAEDFVGAGSRRCVRVQGLIEDIQQLATQRKVLVQLFSRSDIRSAFSKSSAHTKHQIAEEIVKRFTELFPRLPPFRKPWMSEDYRMAIFDAMSLALTYFYFNNQEEIGFENKSSTV